MRGEEKDELRFRLLTSGVRSAQEDRFCVQKWLDKNGILEHTFLTHGRTDGCVVFCRVGNTVEREKRATTSMMMKEHIFTF